MKKKQQQHEKLPLSPLQLKKYNVIHFYFHLPEEESVLQPDKPLPYKFGIHIEQNIIDDNSRKILLMIRFVNAENEDNVLFEMGIEGEFIIHPKFPAEKRNDFMINNGVAILYSMARSIIMEYLNHTPFKNFLLPTINVQAITKDLLKTNDSD